jgi:hypothetical protein
MNRTTAIVICWSWLCWPASALVGDAPTAEWTIRRPAVMVHGARSRCSGVVITQDLVLSAAHCVVISERYNIFGHIGATPIRLADVTAIVPHPQFNREVKPGIADLSLLKLSKPLPSEFAPAFFDVRPVAVGDRMIVVGYGIAAGKDKKSFGTPRMATLTVLDRTATLLMLRDQTSNSIGSCFGDSGGPAFSIRGGVPALAGVVSAGDCDSVSIVIPSSPYRDWITETARKLGSALDR